MDLIYLLLCLVSVHKKITQIEYNLIKNKIKIKKKLNYKIILPFLRSRLVQLRLQ